MDKNVRKLREVIEVNNSNLIPNSERSQEELREMGRKGGIASGKARRKKKRIQQEVKMIIEWLEKNGTL